MASCEFPKVDCYVSRSYSLAINLRHLAQLSGLLLAFLWAQKLSDAVEVNVNARESTAGSIPFLAAVRTEGTSFVNGCEGKLEPSLSSRRLSAGIVHLLVHRL